MYLYIGLHITEQKGGVMSRSFDFYIIKVNNGYIIEAGTRHGDWPKKRWIAEDINKLCDVIKEVYNPASE